jgi:very-short-patch-repair endonuclease
VHKEADAMLAEDQKVMSKILGSARRKLLETGTRNRLIHVNRANKRANCLNVINERSDEIYRILRRDGKRMRFRAMGKDKFDVESEPSLATPDVHVGVELERFTDNVIETPLGPEALARRLLRLAHDAKTAEEEQGLNILFLAMGFLRWREGDSSEVQREAPLLLVPIQLVRNERTSTFDVQVRDDDMTTNLPLQERLRQDFGILLPDVEDVEDRVPSDYFAQVEDSISAKSGWSVDENGMQIGFFSFAKLLMHRDLDPSTWPDGSLSENELLSGLLAEGFEADTPLFDPQDRLDDHLDPAQIIQVIDADASQTKVIEEVRRGASLVVQGPPGTGKSQTITNIIAAAAHDGKTVLFVAEKMAALSVVHDRLVKAGLKDICLELHSRTANKKALAQELGRTLMASARAMPAASDPGRLRMTRDELNRIAELLHGSLPPHGETPFGAISEIIGFIGKGAPPPSIPLAGLENLNRESRRTAYGAIKQFTAALDAAGALEEHPYRGVKELDLQPTDLHRLANDLRAAAAAIEDLKGQVAHLARLLHRTEPVNLAEVEDLRAGLAMFAEAPAGVAESLEDLFEHVGTPRLEEALIAGVEWAGARAAAEARFARAAWTAQLTEIRQALVRGKASLLARLFGKYRQASAEFATLLTGNLPKAPAERLALVDELSEVQSRRARLEEEEAWLRPCIGPAWRGERTDFGALLSISRWLAKLKQTRAYADSAHVVAAIGALPDPRGEMLSLEGRVRDCRRRSETAIARLQLDLSGAGIGEDIDTATLSELAAAFAQMASRTDRYSEWATLARSVENLLESGAGGVVAAVEEGRVQREDAVRVFAYACAEARWNTARASRPELDALPRLDRHNLVALFKTLEKDRIEAAKTLILSRHFEQVPRGTLGEMGVIRGEIGRKRGHKPIRWVMKNAGGMVQRIKPVLLMSPISVAQFLPPGTVTFDLLIIDEASQIRPEEAIGVIARARQIVVVGDQKQLPPTSFFDRLVDDVEEDDDEEEGAPIGASAADMESILTLCEVRGLRSRMLEWHYRSRDPSLIRVSNAEFYDDRLVLPPSPLQLDANYGLKFHRVAGVYARGGSGLGRQGTNRFEAEEVVRAVSAHARDWSDLSLGVVAFSKAQADMLTEVLELERRGDPVLDAFLREGKREDIFVKNIENVQGDERDVILISVGYGPQSPNGPLTSMSFGPVNGEGGERRLNVLFSRARVRCEVFASFDPGAIDPKRSSRDGPRILKRFLEYAKSGVIDEHIVSGLDADSPFEEDVAAVIRSLGFLVDLQVGSAGFRIDLAVRHEDRPGQYLLAVECDGAAYHSALWARERDRLRQEVLENLGWRFHRIWSTDWFHHRSREINRLREALTQARDLAASGIKVTGANTDGLPFTPALQMADVEERLDIHHLTLTAAAYVRAQITIRSMVEPHEVAVTQLADLVAKIVDIEGPIHMDEVARRISSAFGKSRTGNRIAEATERAVRFALSRDTGITLDGRFLMTAYQRADIPVRDRSAETGSLLKASYLPPMEIEAAGRRLLAESGSMSPEELTRAVARLLGFQRVGPDLAVAISEVVHSMADAAISAG